LYISYSVIFQLNITLFSFSDTNSLQQNNFVFLVVVELNISNQLLCRFVCGSEIQGIEQHCNLPLQQLLMLVSCCCLSILYLSYGKTCWLEAWWWCYHYYQLRTYYPYNKIFILCYSLVQVLPTVAYSDNPSTSFAAKFVHTSLNKNRCSINRVLVS
jgi:hypothetical protein